MNKRTVDESQGPDVERGDEVVPVDDAEYAVVLARLTKALGHPARVEIVRLLLRHGRCVCSDIVRRLPLAQSTVSQHLKMLRESGLIRGKPDGSRIHYYVNTAILERLKTLVEVLRGGEVNVSAEGSVPPP